MRQPERRRIRFATHIASLATAQLTFAQSSVVTFLIGGVARYRKACGDMADLAFIGLTVVFFAIAAAYVSACERVK